MQNFAIQVLKEQELDILIELIKEFALHEIMQDEIKCNKENLYHSIFKTKVAKAFLLKENNKTIGYMIYFYTFSSFLGANGIYLEDIYLKKEYRNKGYGKQVFKFLADICQKENLQRLEWLCLNDNKEGIKFYENLSSIHLNQWRIYRLNKDQLNKLSNND
ncbi:GNAT family N-acetyltransferase [Campylobacter sp. 2018MI35]|uniref:GNAT family N-acetyltransferase n=2 Tax=unclassified Campylobacter TaxID=2593542 RepID=UPI001908313C|nr:GNAT family N-acetyltransferase [Campylobacter sp. 2018MI34]MBK1991579.1 GNAT family N-acetyltransferase [Campylobacter sp. 2018MI34]